MTEIASKASKKSLKKRKTTLVIRGPYQIQTFGTRFDYENPKRSTVTLPEVAECLGNICRWGGWCRPWYSVLQHAIFVSDQVYEATNDPLAALYGLHHDDHEAFRGDIPSPRKRYLKKHKQLYKGEEIRQDKWLYEALLGLQYPVPERIHRLVKDADLVALYTEKKYLKPASIWSQDTESRALSRTDFEFYLNLEDPVKTYLEIHKHLKGLINV